MGPPEICSILSVPEVMKVMKPVVCGSG